MKGKYCMYIRLLVHYLYVYINTWEGVVDPWGCASATAAKYIRFFWRMAWYLKRLRNHYIGWKLKVTKETIKRRGESERYIGRGNDVGCERSRIKESNTLVSKRLNFSLSIIVSIFSWIHRHKHIHKMGKTY